MALTKVSQVKLAAAFRERFRQPIRYEKGIGAAIATGLGAAKKIEGTAERTGQKLADLSEPKNIMLDRYALQEASSIYSQVLDKLLAAGLPPEQARGVAASILECIQNGNGNGDTLDESRADTEPTAVPSHLIHAAPQPYSRVRQRARENARRGTWKPYSELVGN